MGRHKRARELDSYSRPSSPSYSSSDYSDLNLSSHDPETRFKRLLSERQKKDKRRKKASTQTQDSSLDRENSRASFYHQHFHHHHYHLDEPSRTGTPASTSSSFSNRPSNYADAQAYPHYHRSRATNKTFRMPATYEPTHFSPPQHYAASHETHQLAHSLEPTPPHASMHSPRPSSKHADLPVRRISTNRRTRDLPPSRQLSRTATSARSTFQNNATATRPRRKVHTAASLEQLNKLEFGSPTLMIRRKRSQVYTKRSPLRRLFLRLFRRRTRATFYYTKAQLRKPFSISRNAEDRLYTQYKVKPVQILGLRPLPRIPSQRASPVQISQPLQVTKHAGIDTTSRGEVLSIRRPVRSRRSSSMLRVKIPPDSPLGNATHLVQPLPRLGSRASRRSHADYDQIDDRLHSLQRKLDETKQLKYRLSQRRDSLSSSSTSLHRRGSQASLGRNKSFISITSTVLPTLDDHPDIIKRSDLFRKGSRNSQYGHLMIPPTATRISQMDIENEQDPARVEEAMAFVNTWSEYLRRAIAVRIKLRQEIKAVEQEDEWQHLHSVEEEQAGSQTEDSDSMRSFNTETSDSRGSQSGSRTFDNSNNGHSVGRTNSRFADAPQDSSSTHNGAGGERSSSTSDGTKYQTGIPRVPHSPVSQRPSLKQQGLSSKSSSFRYSTDENLVYGDGNAYFDYNGDEISITPVSTRQYHASAPLSDVTNVRKASSIRKAIREGRLHHKYSALMNKSNVQNRHFSASAVVSPKFLKSQQNLRPSSSNSNSSQTSLRSLGKPGAESMWMRSSSSSGQSSNHKSRPLPPLPGQNKRVVSEPMATSGTSERNSYASSQSYSSGTNDEGTKSNRSNVLPQLLRDQRNMSEKLLADMVQEMEELQARSELLSDMAKNQADATDSESQGNKAYQTPVISEGSNSEFSVSPVTKPKGIPAANPDHYVLDSPSEPSFQPTAAFSASNAPVFESDPQTAHSLHRLGSVPQMQAARLGDLSGGSSSSMVDERRIPRKISKAESIAASASVNLSRGGQNRRRPRSETSSRRSSLQSRSSNGSSGSSIGLDRLLPPDMATEAGSSGSLDSSIESSDRLRTTWINMDAVTQDA